MSGQMSIVRENLDMEVLHRKWMKFFCLTLDEKCQAKEQKYDNFPVKPVIKLLTVKPG